MEAGASLDVAIEGERVILTRSQAATPKAKLTTHPVTGLPVLSVVEGSPKLTGVQVSEILADFP